jgi:hypothetical protein
MESAIGSAGTTASANGSPPRPDPDPDPDPICPICPDRRLELMQPFESHPESVLGVCDGCRGMWMVARGGEDDGPGWKVGEWVGLLAAERPAPAPAPAQAKPPADRPAGETNQQALIVAGVVPASANLAGPGTGG